MMRQLVMSFAQPTNVKRLLVIGVMSFDLNCRTNIARLSMQAACPECNEYCSARLKLLPIRFPIFSRITEAHQPFHFSFTTDFFQ